MPPTFHQLEVFVAVARSGSLARAAEELSLSPSAVTLQVQQLERLYACKLFERTARGALLTDSGRTLLTAAESVQATMQTAASAITGNNAPGRDTLNVGGTEVVGIYVLPLAVAAFRGRQPHVDVNL